MVCHIGPNLIADWTDNTQYACLRAPLQLNLLAWQSSVLKPCISVCASVCSSLSFLVQSISIFAVFFTFLRFDFIFYILKKMIIQLSFWDNFYETEGRRLILSAFIFSSPFLYTCILFFFFFPFCVLFWHPSVFLNPTGFDC